jgi:hypothetical protein
LRLKRKNKKLEKTTVFYGVVTFAVVKPPGGEAFFIPGF